MSILFVDGYNIIGAWSELKALRDEVLEFARDALISTMSEYAALSGSDVILVFDGHQREGNRGTEIETKHLKIIYTPEGVTADMMIERLCAQLPRFTTAYVATSDKLEQEVVLAQGALRISARELKEMVNVLTEEATVRQETMPQGLQYDRLDDRLPKEVREQLKSMVLEESKKKTKKNENNA